MYIIKSGKQYIKDQGNPRTRDPRLAKKFADRDSAQRCCLTGETAVELEAEVTAFEAATATSAAKKLSDDPFWNKIKDVNFQTVPPTPAA